MPGEPVQFLIVEDDPVQAEPITGGFEGDPVAFTLLLM